MIISNIILIGRFSRKVLLLGWNRLLKGNQKILNGNTETKKGFYISNTLFIFSEFHVAELTVADINMNWVRSLEEV